MNSNKFYSETASSEKCFIIINLQYQQKKPVKNQIIAVLYLSIYTRTLLTINSTFPESFYSLCYFYNNAINLRDRI